MSQYDDYLDDYKPKREKFVKTMDIPIPGVNTTKTEYIKNLQIGESFLMDKGDMNVHALAKLAGVKVKTRTENGMVRVWRTA